MSSFSLPPLAVGHDSRWIDVDLSGDLSQWAQRAAAGVAAPMSHGRHARLAALMEGAGRLARGAGDAFMALLLYPAPGEGIQAIVRFCAVDLAGREGEEAWSALLADTESGGPQQEPDEVTEITTSAGPCRRFLLRRAAGEPGTGETGEQVAYVWLFPRYSAGVVMTTAFLSVAEADRWRPALDELAAAVALEQAKAVPQPGPGVIEIRPARPPGRLTPADNAVLRKWLLRADPATKALEFTEDRAFLITPQRSITFPLPSTGRADAVHAVSLVSYRWIRNLQTGMTWRPLFVGGDGRVLGAGRTRDLPRAGQMWPLRVFRPLESLGITVLEQTYDTEKQFRSAHPAT